MEESSFIRRMNSAIEGQEQHGGFSCCNLKYTGGFYNYSLHEYTSIFSPDKFFLEEWPKIDYPSDVCWIPQDIPTEGEQRNDLRITLLLFFKEYCLTNKLYEQF